MCFLFATPAVQKKIEAVHKVSFLEVEEAYFSFNGTPIEDTREQHKTIPPTFWFLSYTFDGRLLKLVVIFYKKQGLTVLRTAYDPSSEEIMYYEANV